MHVERTCDICETTLQNKKNFNEHMKKMHGKKRKNEDGAVEEE
jgi:hypothetical protein